MEKCGFGDKENQNFPPEFYCQRGFTPDGDREKPFEAFREERREARKKSVTILGRGE